MIWQLLANRNCSKARRARPRLAFETLEDRTVPAGDLIAFGPESGLEPRVRVFDTNTDLEVASFLAYEATFKNGVRVAVGDINDDGALEVITAPGRRHTPEIKIFDAATGNLLDSFLAFPKEYKNGVNVAVGDVNNDDKDDIIVSAFGQVKVIDGTLRHLRLPNGEIADGALLDFFRPYGDTNKREIHLAAGYVNDDNFADIITGAGAGGKVGPLVKVFSGVNNTDVLHSFFAFEPTFIGGVFVGAGDVDGFGRADIITGAGPSRKGLAGPHVKVFNGADRFEVLHRFFDLGPDNRAGFHVGAGDVNDDGRTDIFASEANIADPEVSVFDGGSGAVLTPFSPFGADVKGAFAAGIVSNFVPPFASPNSLPREGVALRLLPEHILNDLYVFRSPVNPANTVFVMTVDPLDETVTSLRDQFPRVKYRINVDHIGGDAVPDSIFEVVVDVGPEFVQRVRLTRSTAGITTTLARGLVGQNLPVLGGGTFRAGVQDDPAFFDQVGFNRLLNNAANALPRPVGTALNFYGPIRNRLALTLELPSSNFGAAGSLIGVWGSAEFRGDQVDRIGRPFILDGLIPPIPRGSNFPVDPSIPNRDERRDDFMRGVPADDRTNFKPDLVAVLQNFYGRNATDANAIADLLLPDVLVHDVTSTEGFGVLITGLLGNGRRLRDDVNDFFLNLTTNGAITTDNIPDDNAGAPTSAVNPIQANFPYIGAANAFPN